MAPRYQLAAKFLEMAKGEVGVREIGGQNRGPRVEEYQRTVGGKPGDAYCVSGAYWCYDQAVTALNAADPRLKLVNPMPRTASVLRLWELTPERFRIPPWTNSGQVPPQPGWLGLHRSKTKPGRGHLVVVAGVVGGLTVATVEFNTDGAGSREGNGVHEKQRDGMYFDIGFIDFARFERDANEDITAVVRRAVA